MLNRLVLGSGAVLPDYSRQNRADSED